MSSVDITLTAEEWALMVTALKRYADRQEEIVSCLGGLNMTDAAATAMRARALENRLRTDVRASDNFLNKM